MKKYLVLTILFLIFYIMYCGKRNSISNSIVITNSSSSSTNNNSPNAINSNAVNPQQKGNGFLSYFNPKNWFADEVTTPENTTLKSVFIPYKNNSIWESKNPYVLIKQDKADIQWDNIKAAKASLTFDIGDVIHLEFQDKRIHFEEQLYAYFNTRKMFEDGYKIDALNEKDKQKALPLLSKKSFIRSLKAKDELYIACEKIGKDTIITFTIINENNDKLTYTYANAKKYEIELFGNADQ